MAFRAKSGQQPKPQILKLDVAVQAICQDRDDFSPCGFGGERYDRGESHREQHNDCGDEDQRQSPWMADAKRSYALVSRTGRISLRHRSYFLSELPVTDVLGTHSITA